MTDQESISKSLELIKKTATTYLKTNNNVHDVVKFKERVKDFLTNPLWNDKSLFQLKNQINELNLSENEFKSLWKGIEISINEIHRNFLEKKPHIFKGKVREYEKRLISYLIEFGKYKEQNEIFSSIIGYLLIHKRLTQLQLKDLTGFSKGAISNTLKTIVEKGSINKELIKGTRKYSYTIGENLSQVAANTTNFKAKTNEVTRKFLREKVQELNAFKDKKGHDILSQRISEIMNFLEIREKILVTISKSTLIKEMMKSE